MAIKRRDLVVAFALLVGVAGGVSTSTNARPKHHPHQARVTAVPTAAVGAFCDPSLWSHVYAGDPRRFSKPQDRLQVIQDCVTVTGTIFTAKPEKDGDFHIRLKLDPQFASMLNAKNRSGQLGSLVVEPVCMNPVTQRDTIQQHACDGFAQRVYTPDMLHQHVRVVGAYVTDMEHGWNEIHPVTWISIEP
jgi:hypothetical protein